MFNSKLSKEKKKKPWFIVFAIFHGATPPSMADVMLRWITEWDSGKGCSAVRPAPARHQPEVCLDLSCHREKAIPPAGFLLMSVLHVEGLPFPGPPWALGSWFHTGWTCSLPHGRRQGYTLFYSSCKQTPLIRRILEQGFKQVWGALQRQS